MSFKQYSEEVFQLDFFTFQAWKEKSTWEEQNSVRSWRGKFSNTTWTRLETNCIIKMQHFVGWPCQRVKPGIFLFSCIVSLNSRALTCSATVPSRYNILISLPPLPWVVVVHRMVASRPRVPGFDPFFGEGKRQPSCVGDICFKLNTYVK